MRKISLAAIFLSLAALMFVAGCPKNNNSTDDMRPAHEDPEPTRKPGPM